MSGDRCVGSVGYVGYVGLVATMVSPAIFMGQRYFDGPAPAPAPAAGYNTHDAPVGCGVVIQRVNDSLEESRGDG